MLNSAPLNSWPLNALAGGADEQEDPIIIPTGHAFRWTATVTMGGIDVTELLTGSIRVDREEGAAGLAEFELFYPVGTAVVTDIADRTVTIDYTTDDGQDATQVRLFTGLVAEPSWDAVRRVMSITCTDNLQQRIEALDISTIDTLVEGTWSADIFEPVDGRSRWDYAQERMSSRQASLDISPTGDLRVTEWKVGATPDFVFNAGTTAYESVNVSLAQLRNVTNRVELEISYRYPRLREAQKQFKWDHPAGSFCEWRKLTSELPTKEMVFSATVGANLVPITVSFDVLPPTAPDPCGNGQPWINRFDNLLLGVTWAGARRWAQTVTETHKMALFTTAGGRLGQEVISRKRLNINVDNEISAQWATSLVSVDPDNQDAVTPLPVSAGDLPDDDRRVAVFGCIMDIAKTEIYASHRQTLVSWAVPTSMALGVDLSHTVEVNDYGAHAKAKCSHRVDEINFETGSAITTLTLAVSRGGGISDPLTIPQRAGIGDTVDNGAGWGDLEQLSTQLGGRFTSPEYNENLDGFSGNYSTTQDYTLPVFPRSLSITAPLVDESIIDEAVHEVDLQYRVGVPNNTLEL